MARRTNERERYVAYLRCSTDDQAHGDYTTIDTQREISTEHVAQCGGVLVQEYADEGTTGTNLKRRGYKELLRDAKAGLFDVVCCTYMSRLGRGDAHTIAEWQLKEAGVRVEYVKEKFTNDMAGYVNKQMIRFMDGMYPQMVRQWTTTKMERMLKAGYFCGGRTAFGYRAELFKDAVAGLPPGDKEPPKKLVGDPDTAPIVLQAFERFVATRNATIVMEYLRTVTGLPWSYQKVSYLLKNRTYRGVARWGNLINEAAHEPIVPEDLWNAAQEIFAQGAENRARRPKRQGVARPDAYYLRGLVVCQTCGGKMTTADHVGRRAPVRYYECIRAIKFGDTGCPVRRVNADSLHQSVVSEIQRLAAHPWRVRKVIEDVVRHLPRAEKRQAEEAQVARRVRDAEKKIEGLTNTIALLGAQSRALGPLLHRLESLEEERFALQQEKQRITREIAAARVTRPTVTDVHRLFGRFAELWKAATEQERAELLPLLVGEVRMETKEKGSLQILLNLRSPLREFGYSSKLRESNGTRTRGLQSHNLAL